MLETRHKKIRISIAEKLDLWGLLGNPQIIIGFPTC